jgi:hypothetical protein
MKETNIGQTGLDSLRIDGMRIGNIPLGQGNEAKEGLTDFLKTEKENLKNDILARYPKHKQDFLKSQVQECKLNIKNIKNFKSKLREQIAEYRQIIKDCDFRENEINKYNKDNPEDAEKIKQLRLKYPPYDVEALQQQIQQFEESIERCDEVIEKDYESVTEIQQILVLVEHRERELKNV